MTRLRVLISAYACEPGKGSEPGVGWNMAKALAQHHDVWVLTRANNRPAIEAALERQPVSGLHFAYFDLPTWTRWWKRGGRGTRVYYYLWQLRAYLAAKRLHEENDFHVAHHVTFVKYWAPSLLSRLPIPFVWGPVGGGESAPKAFWTDFSSQGRRYELLRDLARWLGEHDPLVRHTARRSSIALATTQDTAERLTALGAEDVRVSSEAGISPDELDRLGRHLSGDASTIRFVSVANLLHLKGFHLGLRAFAAAALPTAEYWVIGDGPERKRLEALTSTLGISSQVRFLGKLPREQVLTKMATCTALVHPSLHDSGGWVSLEAMAVGKPVICLDLGGPSVQVTPETGFKVPALSPDQVVGEMAVRMRLLAEDEVLRDRLGAAGRARVSADFNWAHKAEAVSQFYAEALHKPRVERHKLGNVTDGR